MYSSCWICTKVKDVEDLNGATNYVAKALDELLDHAVAQILVSHFATYNMRGPRFVAGKRKDD